MFEFLIDTADEVYIREKWEFLKKHFPKENMVGITTNPNAFFKMNDLSLEQWSKRLKVLANLIEEIREDKNGELHVQFPNSDLTEELFTKWVSHLDSLELTNVKLFIKVPPFADKLRIVEKFGRNLNVTGVADAGTALNSLSYDIKYMSIIPGRMEEVGIDARAHVEYVQNRSNDNKKVITGSMRTLECLKWCIETGTMPTVGTRVLDLFNEENINEIIFWQKDKIKITKFCPTIDIRNTNLSRDFFEQMDNMGITCHKDLQNKKSFRKLQEF